MNDQGKQSSRTDALPTIVVGERRAYDLTAVTDFAGALAAAVDVAAAQDTIIVSDAAGRETAEAALAAASKSQLVMTALASCEIQAGTRVTLHSVLHADDQAVLLGLQRPGAYRVITPAAVVLVERGEFDIVEGAVSKPRMLRPGRGAAAAG
ncbi:MAG: hypothetical protein ACJ74Q_15575 [Pyrinomonadaceae bacterium]